MRHTGYGYNGKLDIAAEIESQEEKQQRKKKECTQQVLYAKEYDNVLEIIDKLEEVLSTYGLEVGCVAGTYSPIDIQVHITEFGKSNL